MANTKLPTLPPAPWDKKHHVTGKVEPPGTELDPLTKPLDANTIERIIETIDRISAVHPINYSKVMRHLDRGSINFRVFFNPSVKRVTGANFAVLCELFGCETAEEFFALDPHQTLGLKELIHQKGLDQYSWRKIRI